MMGGNHPKNGSSNDSTDKEKKESPKKTDGQESEERPIQKRPEEKDNKKPVMKKKPVILLYNYNENEHITVSLSLKSPKEKFLSVYPIPRVLNENSVKWNIIFKENEKLQFSENQKCYPYLFWESVNLEKENFSLKNFLCVKNSEVEEKLDYVLARKGLNFKERCDMITFWLAELKSSEFVKIGFLDENVYESLFPLEICPHPTNILRIFMVFENCEQEEKSTMGNWEKEADFVRNGPTLVEWGGMNLKN